MKRAFFITLFLIIPFISSAQYSPPLPEVSDIDSWNGSQWTPSSRIEFTFNVNCLYTIQLWEFLGENFLRFTVDYIEDLYPSEFISQNWDANTQQWVDFGQIVYTYNNNILVSTTNSSWNNNSWEPISRWFYTYNGSDQIIESIYQEYNVGTNSWENYSQTIYTYLGNGSVNQETTFRWDPNTNTYNNNRRETYVYDGPYLDIIRIEGWDAGQWNNARIRDFSYNNDNNIIEDAFSNWDETLMVYVNDSRTLYNNITDGLPSTIIEQSWVGNSWVNASRDSRVYPDCLELSIDEFSLIAARLYPNPANDQTTVFVKEPSHYVLTSINGQKIMQGELNTGENNLDISALPQGVYFLQMKNETGQHTKKLIKN